MSFYPSLHVRRFGLVALLGAALAGCSTNAPTPSSSAQGVSPAANLQRDRLLSRGFAGVASHRAQSPGWLAPDARKRRIKTLIYWGSYDQNTIYVFSAKGTNPPEKGQITTGLSNPERLFVDKALDVYSTNLGNNTITAYKRGTTSPFLTISNSVNTPTGLTVDAEGTVYCANVGNDTITEYPKGKTIPSLTIDAFAEYLATDANDNLYASEGSNVYEFAPGSTSGKDLNLNIGSPGALEVDKSGNIIVIDESSNAIDVFPAGQTQPSEKIPVTAGSPFALSLNKKETAVFATVEVNGGFILQELAYPKGTTLTTKISGTTYGEWPIAVSPDAAL
ncbi:MAG TPA: hypothetical protein VHT92_09265 [Candidatus Cybelea sp.]|jgi:hypothetical protein|nr:hypothetical protein [Candidatus Cybelea sp.]